VNEEKERLTDGYRVSWMSATLRLRAYGETRNAPALMPLRPRIPKSFALIAALGTTASPLPNEEVPRAVFAFPLSPLLVPPSLSTSLVRPLVPTTPPLLEELGEEGAAADTSWAF
jgi:hypothetical protein